MNTVCAACGSVDCHPSLTNPVDYEYGVRPTRPFHYVRCGECGSETLAPRPTDAELVSFYPGAYHAYADDHGLVARALVAARAELRGRKYRALLPTGAGALFDVGTGDTRHFRELARFADLRCAGVEIQPEVAARGRAEGHDITTGTLEGMDIGPHIGQYDIVSMNHVIEHVSSPPEVMRRVFALLKPGGHVIGQLPTSSGWESRIFGRAWAGYHYPRHLQVFSRLGLARLLEAHGFQNVRIRSSPHCQIAISIQNALIAAGWRPRMAFGRSPLYGLLLLASLPAEAFAALCDRSGIIDFSARRPPR